MTDIRPSAAPWHLWVVGILALLWNAFGTFAWAGTTFMAEQMLATLPDAQRDYVLSLPVWSSAAWALGVLGGLLGAALLLLRSRHAVTAFAASLLGALVNQLVYVTNPSPAGFFNLPLTAFIIFFAVFELWYAQSVRAYLR